MKNSTFSKPWSYLRDLVSTDAAKSRRRSTLWLMLFTLLLLPTSMVAQTDKAYADFNNGTLTFKYGSKPTGAYDLNVGTNNPGWLAQKEKINKVVFDASFANARPTSCYYWFSECKNLTDIEGIEYLNTEKVTNMNSMFDRCSALTLLDLTSFNTAKVSDMRYMFMGCYALTTIFVSDKFVTDQVTSGDNMFHMCINLIGAIEYDGSKSDHNFANYKTGYFTPEGGFHAYAEFDEGTGTLTFRRGASKPEGAYDLNVGINYPGWWYGQKKEKIKTVVFDASFANARPTSCYCWFSGCNNLTEIKGIEYLNTENVTNMGFMFNSCKVLTSLNLTSFNTEKVTDMQGMFGECWDLTSLDLSNFNPEKVTNMRHMFYNCSDLTSLNLSNFNTEKVMYMSNMFYNCNKLTSLDLSNFNTAKVTDMAYMFKTCKALTSLDLTSFNTAKVENMTEMFYNSNALTTIYASDKFVTDKVTNSGSMFYGCTELKGFIDKYDENKIDGTYANYKTGYFTKLVAKNGDERYGIAGETAHLTVDNLALDDEKDFVAYEPFAAKTASYIRTMKAGTTWGTLCLPFEVSLDGQNFRAFKLLSANDATNTIVLEEITTSIAAGTPVIIKMTNGATELNFSVNNKDIAKDAQTTATADNNYQLQGLYAKKVFVKDTDDNCYIVKGNKLMNPSKLLENTNVQEVNCKAFRAYMVDNSSKPAGAKMFSIGFDETATAIDNLNNTADDKAEYYDLQGHRLNGPQRGVNIVKRGNKTMKVIIK